MPLVLTILPAKYRVDFQEVINVNEKQKSVSGSMLVYLFE